MLRWNWDRILGEIEFAGKDREGKPWKWKKRMYQGNCLAVLGEKARDADGKIRWTVYADYWNSIDDLKIILGLKEGWDGEKYNRLDDAKQVWLNSAFWDKEMEQMAKLFVKAGIPVKISRREPRRRA